MLMKKLTNDELLNLMGGDVTTRKEFCDQLRALLNSGTLTPEAEEGAQYALNKECEV